jgi:hypothetical protein
MTEILDAKEARKKVANYPNEMLPSRISEILREQMGLYAHISSFSKDYLEGACAAFAIADAMVQTMLTSDADPSEINPIATIDEIVVREHLLENIKAMLHTIPGSRDRIIFWAVEVLSQVREIHNILPYARALDVSVRDLNHMIHTIKNQKEKRISASAIRWILDHLPEESRYEKTIGYYRKLHTATQTPESVSL